MTKLKIKLLHPEAVAPTYATALAAAVDLYAIEPARVYARQSATIRTGIAVEFPAGYALQVYSRSGMGFKHGVRLVNGVGLIDADYRGELLVGLHNDGLSDLVIAPGMRIAQAALVRIETPEIEVVDELTETARGAGGFGSTGS